MDNVAPLAGSVDRNFNLMAAQREKFESLPSRGAWIEMSTAQSSAKPIIVAPLAGSVDRNEVWASMAGTGEVAPLAGSVDRNILSPSSSSAAIWSLPSRGAWIEISLWEGHDNNVKSLPSRGAWIEMVWDWLFSACALRRSPRGERG